MGGDKNSLLILGGGIHLFCSLRFYCKCLTSVFTVCWVKWIRNISSSAIIGLRSWSALKICPTLKKKFTICVVTDSRLVERKLPMWHSFSCFHSTPIIKTSEQIITPCFFVYLRNLPCIILTPNMNITIRFRREETNECLLFFFPSQESRKWLLSIFQPKRLFSFSLTESTTRKSMISKNDMDNL